jgi:hypothetical protein
LKEKEALQNKWGGWNNEEQYIDCGFLDKLIEDDDIPF